MHESGKGKLYLISTPIGNWDDITLRALRLLGEVSVVAAEDTRYARRLLTRHGIRARLISCHAYNEERRAETILSHLGKGEDVGLITDSGTPGVSDPGSALVAAAAEAGFEVIPVPGPSAAIAAISISGLKGQGFRFVGFIPRSGAKRRRRIESLLDDDGLLVFYESPRRIKALLADLLDVLGDRPAVLCRELTKRYEEILRASLSDLIQQLTAEVKGEVILVVGTAGRRGRRTGARPGSPAADRAGDQECLGAADCLVKEGLKTREAVDRLVHEYALSRKKAYSLILKVKNKNKLQRNGKNE